MNHSITVEVVLDFAEGDGQDSAEVIVDGHNLPDGLAEQIARHYLAVELGLDAESEMADIALEEADGMSFTFVRQD